ncbi:MAG: hypothetical protein NTY22_00155 [Proteobacteria bacterium]|nr:hypothetical protein [Pseudomonadota bacterium]
MKITLIIIPFSLGLCFNLSANINTSINEKTLIIVKSSTYNQQLKSRLSASNPELPFSDDRCGDSQIESNLKKDNNLALMDIEGSYHTLNCNYCRNGIYYDVRSTDAPQQFYDSTARWIVRRKQSSYRLYGKNRDNRSDSLFR